LGDEPEAMTRRVMQEVQEDSFIAELFDGNIFVCRLNAGRKDLLRKEKVNEFEWWMVTSAFANVAHKSEEVTFITCDGNVWGRRNHKLPLDQDVSVQKVLKAMGEI
jgi:hypothetical protein